MRIEQQDISMMCSRSVLHLTLDCTNKARADFNYKDIKRLY